ncbi:MAG: pyridoxal-phosphate dependent enzyme, partial [Candidatus Thermoplasmatota archaeon]|nr:pyridoxal-phosphate dependent enzyme [Candidatus Thermoplasmatota archaeon]
MGSFEIPSLEDIRKASESIKGQVNRTPLDYSRTFSDSLQSEVYFKLENMQKTGSFKTRGALYKMSSLNAEERRKGVIAVSAGNHAQGVAYAANMHGIHAKIIMPEFTTPAKVNAVMGYRAEVILKGKDYNEAREHALRICKE